MAICWPGPSTSTWWQSAGVPPSTISAYCAENYVANQSLKGKCAPARKSVQWLGTTISREGPHGEQACAQKYGIRMDQA
jgi:hypothetical protein